MSKAKKTKERPCVHCGNLTVYAWVDMRFPDSDPGMMPICSDCIHQAKVGHRPAARRSASLRRCLSP